MIIYKILICISLHKLGYKSLNIYWDVIGVLFLMDDFMNVTNSRSYLHNACCLDFETTGGSTVYCRTLV